MTALRLVMVFALGASLFAGENWNPKSAAAYLDQRAAWWIAWKPAARDQGTFCVSCHTALPYALARPALRQALGENGPTPNETQLLDNIRKRVRLWTQIEPLYPDAKYGAPKSAESRSSEAVLNALVLVAQDATSGKLSEESRLALDHMWALQLRDGEKKGAWSWMDFHNEPWEAPDSGYWGAALAALTVGLTPPEYRESAETRERLALLTGYLRGKQAQESLLNQVTLLWASTKLPDLLSHEEQIALMEQFWSKQQDDGGWSTSSLVAQSWKRGDGTALESGSDGYATGILLTVFEQAGVSGRSPRLKRGLAWLTEHQDKAAGLWPAWSLNKKKDPASDTGRFMSDAATAYAVMALTGK